MRKLLFPIIFIMILIFGCRGEIVKTQQGISMSNISSITIKALPSPPNVKTINGKEDIEKIINHINSIEKGKVEQEDINGWEFWIQTKGKKEHSITLVGNLIKINGVWYRMSSDEVKKFRELYNSLNYKEEPF